MNTKLQFLYQKIFRKIKEIFEQLKIKFTPNAVMSDFERALRNAISIEFSPKHLQGCFFHYCQCIFRIISRGEYSLDLGSTLLISE